MKKNTIFYIAIVIAILILAYFQFTGKEKIAYIEINKMLANYDGMNDAKIEFNNKKTVWLSKTDTLQAELQRSLQVYEKNMAGMSLKQKQDTELNLRSKQQELANYNQVVQEMMQKEQQEITNHALIPADKIIKNYGKKHNLKIILGAMQPGYILYAKDALNITADITEELNKEYAQNK